MELHHQAEAAVKIAAVIVRRRLSLTADPQLPQLGVGEAHRLAAPHQTLAVEYQHNEELIDAPGFPSHSCQPCQWHGDIALRWPWQCSIHVGGSQPVVALQPQVAQVRVSHHALSRSRLANSRVTVSHIALPRLSK